MDKFTTLRPRISEKSYALSQTHNVYVFEVPKEANKLTIIQAVQSQFGVTVEDVNIAIVKGKTKRTVRRRGRQSMGTRPDIKKAYVTLKAGDSIAVFATEEESVKEPAKKEKK